MPHTFPCPRCGEMSQWEDNAFRPFCSERCKLIDLGEWADEKRRVPGEPINSQDSAEDPSEES